MLFRCYWPAAQNAVNLNCLPAAFLSLQRKNAGDHICSQSADVLRHGNTGTRYLSFTADTLQLLDRFDNLI